MKNIYPALFALTLISGYSNNLEISDIEVSENNHNIDVRFTIAWEHSWNNSKNHDAAWVFFKFLQPNARYIHAKVKDNGHRLMEHLTEPGSGPEFEVPSDQMGVFISPGEPHRGDVKWRVNVRLDPEIKKLDDFEIHRATIQVNALEMVYIPKAAFYVGNGNADSVQLRETASLYKSGVDGVHSGPFKITDESSTIQIANGPDKLFYQSDAENYKGDQKGTLHPSFPKGVDPFYIMKYELRQGQYVDFLNCITTYNSHVRANFGGRNYYSLRGTIGITDETYYAEKPDRPANFVSWDDGLAYADWAALRPMTELEYTKASRGPGKSDSYDFPWGTSQKDRLSRFVDEEGDLVFQSGLDEGDLSDENKERYGASYYWVMDLAGSLWERVITIGHPKGRLFEGTHGDGNLSYGSASNEDWPKGINETGGYGFKGGGFYKHHMVYGSFNPHSPTDDRRFGAWSGGFRTEAYGQRFVRTIE